MHKITLDVESLEVASFVTEDESAERAPANPMMVTGTTCTTRYPTVYGPCCTP
jgi:hypothetical protein